MKRTLISIEKICAHHKIRINFIQSLEDFGIIETTNIKKAVFLDTDELVKLERYIRLRQELKINLEGIHAVSHLLTQVEEMQEEITRLRNELNYYKQLN